jgi:glycosyltransferase involved in cell wall biosynthesis
MLKNEFSIGIMTHTQYQDHHPMHGPADTLLEFLNNAFSANILYIRHPIQKGDPSILEVHAKKIRRDFKTSPFWNRTPNIIRYFLDLFFSIFWVFSREKLRVIIAVDPLNFLYAYVLKLLGKTDKLVYYTVDYAYQRFRNPILNGIYHRLDLFAAKKADLLWSSCKKIKDIRTKQNIKESKNIYLPNMPALKDIKTNREVEPFSLVNIFSNHKQLDLEIMLGALSRLIPYYPGIVLKLIGRGGFAEDLIAKIKDKQLLEHIKFMDIASHSSALQEISSSMIGLECNTQTDSWNEFREPLKIMEYLSLGLPVVSKPGHGMTEEIVVKNLGFIVTNSNEMFAAIHSLFSNPGLYCEIKQNAAEFVKRNNKEEIIKRSLAQIGL